MSIRSIYLKYLFYYKKHGLLKLFRLACARIWRKLFQNRWVMFYFDCTESLANDFNFPENLIVERYYKMEDIPKKDMERLIMIKGKEIVFPFFKKYFRLGAILWLAKLNGEVVGLNWSVIGGFEGFHCFPMTSKDAVILASEVFPNYRGRGINPAMNKRIVFELKKEGITRVFINCEVWNKANLRSIPKVGFKKLGILHTLRIPGGYITFWYKRSLMKNNQGK